MMPKTSFRKAAEYLLASSFLLFFISCGGGGDKSETLYYPENKLITYFAFTATLNSALGSDYNGSINETSITVELPYLTNLSTLVPSFSITGANVRINAVVQQSGVSIVNFTQPVKYIVVADDGSSAEYTVTVSTVKPTYSETAPTIYKYCTSLIDVADAGSTTTQAHRYHFKAPSDYNADKNISYPLVISLHASGYPNSEEALTREQGDFAYLQDGSPYAGLWGSGIPAIFEYSPICPPPYSAATGGPTAPNGGEWNSPAARQMIVSTIKDLMTRFNIDLSRIYLQGFSMGGAGTWYIAQAWYDATGIPIAAISRGAGYSPTNQMLDQGMFPDLYRSAVWYHVGENDSMGLDGSMGNCELGKYTYNKLIAQIKSGSETITERTTADMLSGSDGLTSTLYDYSVAGKSILRLSVYAGRGHEYLAGRNTDFITWLFAQHN